MVRKLLAGACALALAFAPSLALAQSQTGLAVKDGAGTSQTLCTYTVSSNQIACHAEYVWNGSAWVLKPVGAGTATGAPRTVVAQDSTTVAGSASLPAGTNTIGNTGVALQTASGWTAKTLAAITNSATQIKGTAGQLGLLQCYNSTTSPVFIQFFNAVPGSVTLGTTPPAFFVSIAATSTGGFALPPVGAQFSTAISAAATTTATGSTAPTTAADCSVLYN